MLPAVLTLSITACATPRVNLEPSESTVGLSMELQKHAYITWTVDTSKDGRYVLTGSPMAGCTLPLKLWDVRDGRQVWASNEYNYFNSVSCLAFSGDGKSFVVGGQTGKISLMDAETGKVIKDLTGISLMHPAMSLAFSPDGRFLLAGGVNANLQLLDAASGKLIRDLNGHSGFGKYGTVWSVAFSFDGRYGLSGGADGTARLWDIATGKNIRTFKLSSRVGAVAFMPKSGEIVAGDNDGLIKIWDVETNRVVRTFREKLGVVSIAVSSDEHYLFLATQNDMFSGTLLAPAYAAAGTLQEKKVSQWNLATGERLHEYTFQIPKAVQSAAAVRLSPDNKRLFVGGDSSLRIIDVPTWKEIAMATGFEDGEWIVITAEGYYNASPKGAEYLRVRAGKNSYGVDSFYDVFYRPDIVAAKLRGEDISGLVTLTMKDVIKNPPPVVEFTTTPPSSDQPRARVCYDVKSSGGGIGEVRLFQNGKLIQSDGYYRDIAKQTNGKAEALAMNSKAIYENMRSVSVMGTAGEAPSASKPKGNVYDACTTLDAIPGENEVSLAAFNSSNTVQSALKSVTFTSTRKPEPSRLYILSVGIDKYRDTGVTLKYAAKDAGEIAAALRKESASLYDPSRIHFTLLIDGQATKAALLNKISELAAEIRPTDTFILFVAGHGVLLQNQYYMLTHDFDGAVSDAGMVSSNEIVEMSKKIKSLSQLFIFDTCHAGGMDAIVSGLYDARMSVLAKKMGLHIYASASSVQEALDGYQGNGLFSHTLLEGLNNNRQADRNNDNRVSLVELGNYAKAKTVDISKGLGRVQTPFIINFGKDSNLYGLK
jgi:WD40 repeat protein